ncbi:hypothetical protein LOD99_15296 [Oopsacas minuta]|uniref:Uncharacterized protein n=1 Tax=Oopsacas minuta TaxID=111878 RepID=A0AAV7KDR8_9METZ|nr:hypothetical protein LOD99_15296 [Oopsacas minuta]
MTHYQNLEMVLRCDGLRGCMPKKCQTTYGKIKCHPDPSAREGIELAKIYDNLQQERTRADKTERENELNMKKLKAITNELQQCEKERESYQNENAKLRELNLQMLTNAAPKKESVELATVRTMLEIKDKEAEDIFKRAQNLEKELEQMRKALREKTGEILDVREKFKKSQSEKLEMETQNKILQAKSKEVEEENKTYKYLLLKEEN